MSYGTLQIEKMTTESGYSLGAGNASSFKNRLINGAMNINQYNSGTSVLTASGGSYALDRTPYYATVASKVTIQQTPSATETGYATRVAAGFTNYLAATVTTPYTIGSTDYFMYQQSIEGNNISDLAWGTASAKSITLSFWVYCSSSGSFGGSVRAYQGTYSYPFLYTIPTANTWTQISVTVPGPTAGSFPTNTLGSVCVDITMGCGSTYSGTAGSWSSNVYFSATGATNLIGTSGAYLYVTGLQFEVGTVATSFDFRSIGTELSLCQRYLPAFMGAGSVGAAQCTGSGSVLAHFAFPVTARVAPTGITVSNSADFSMRQSTGAATTPTSIVYDSTSTSGAQIYAPGGSGLVAGNASMFQGATTSAKILFTGCEL